MTGSVFRGIRDTYPESLTFNPFNKHGVGTAVVLTLGVSGATWQFGTTERAASVFHRQLEDVKYDVLKAALENDFPKLKPVGEKV